MTPEIVLLGNLLVDDVVCPDGRTRMGQPGGATLYFSLAAALWGASTGLVSLRGTDYPEAAFELLRLHGVDVAGVRELGRPGVRTWLLYEGRVRRVLHRLGCPTHEEVSPEPGDVPEAWRSASLFHLAPMPIAQQGRQAAALGAAGAFVSIDPHEIVTEDSLPAWRQVLAHADAFFPSEDELRLDDAQTDPRRALERLADGRLRFVCYKRGLKGGLLYDARERRFHEWTSRTHGVADPTGAGDAFAAGFLVAHRLGRPVEQCLRQAVVSASFAIEDWGPDALLEANPGAAYTRMREWYGEEVKA